MNNWGANHGAISYGHIGADLITLASILRIPVALHNVAADFPEIARELLIRLEDFMAEIS